MRICPKRDAVCPHGMNCPYTIDQYQCRDETPVSPSPISADVVVEACAQIAYRVCAETRHVTLGDKARSEILALKGTFPAVDGWRTMDSAPDKGVFIGWDDRAGMRFIAVGDNFGEKRYYDADALDSGNYIRAHPTHWVRLTPPAIRSALVDPEGGV